MSDKTHIAWTDATWNPTTGCSKVSAGCKFCYADRDWPRLAANPKSVYYNRPFTDVKLHPERLDQPIRWKRPRRIFVNSMSDLFHEDLTDAEIDRVFATMAATSRHVYQVLTKRPERMQRYMDGLKGRSGFGRLEAAAREVGYTLRYQEIPLVPWPLPNIWLGVSVEDQLTADSRIPFLLNTPAAIRWVSYEPALGPVEFRYFLASPPKVDWIVVGGESGGHARPFDIQWARKTVRDCRAAGVHVFVKQLGAWPFVVEGSKDAREWSANGSTMVMDDCGGVHGKQRAGADPAEWPEDLRVREYPNV